VIAAAFAIIVAQGCAAFLPPPDLQIDWSRNGQPYARDVPVRTSDAERVYRRSYRNGSPDVTRILACNGSVLHDRVGSETDVMLPLELNRSRTVSLNGASVRRIEAPDDAGGGSAWFSVSRYGPQLYGVRERIGVEEIRTPTVSGRVEILRAVLTAIERVAPGVPLPTTDERVLRRLNSQIAEQSLLIRDLRDSLNDRSTMAELQRRMFEDSLRAVERLGYSIGEGFVPRAARMIADSAVRLPSEAEASALGWLWPGAGHAAMGRSGAFWSTAGAVALGTVIAGLAMPDGIVDDLGVNESQFRAGAVIGGSAAYLLFLLVSRASLAAAIEEQSTNSATRESFLRTATVEVSPSGSLVLTVRKGTR
jgi:hypothetical protein